MKTKYMYIGFKFLEEDEKLEHLFEKQAKKGWMLEKIGMSFFKLKKTKPQQLKFFIDCNRPTDDYIYTLEQYGYHYIDNYKILNVFYSEHLDIDPIQSDPVVKALSHKELCKPWSIILSLLLGIFIYNIVDIFDLSTLFFRTIDHIILHFHGFLLYLLIKLVGIYFILSAMTLLVLRIKYNREIKSLFTPKSITTFFLYLHYFIDIVLLLCSTITLISYSINDPSIILSFILFLIISTILNHYINKEIIKVESKPKRFLLTLAAIILFSCTHAIISNCFIDHVIGTPESNAYEKDTYNFSETTHTLLYTVITNYGNSDEKDEFNEYKQTYRETIYRCRNKTIARSLFRALIRDADFQSRIPNDEEIEQIVDKKGSFDSVRDIPFYSYQKSLKNLKQYQYKNVEICCSYDNNYFAIKDNIVYDFSVKENTDIQKLIDFYQL